MRRLVESTQSEMLESVQNGSHRYHMTGSISPRFARIAPSLPSVTVRTPRIWLPRSDVAWYPGMRGDDANHYNRLAKPTLYDTAVALLGPGRSAFLADYRFNIWPTDDRPFFFHFFPLGLSRVSDCAPGLVPWAWGINGCASVVAAVMASLLAMHVGFTTVLALALSLYTATPLLLRRGRPAA